MKFFQVVLFLLAASISGVKSIDYLPLPAKDIVSHSYYTLSYNEKYEQANWVYYTLTDSLLRKPGVKRSNNFREDKKVVSRSAKPSDYTKSGYDRGHLCPAGDMGFDPRAMDESFLMSNMSPQMPGFNRGIWKELEEQVRQWAEIEGRLYVVTGPVFNDPKGWIGKEKVLVPGYFFKIIYDPTDEPKLIAFVFPNEKSDRPLSDYVLSVDDTEKLTGYDFFSQLPDELENTLESRVQLSGWFEGYAPKTPEEVLTKTDPVSSDLYFFLAVILILLVVILFVSVNNRKRRKKRRRK